MDLKQALRFHFITVFPEMIHSYLGQSLFKRALSKNLFTVKTWNPRDYAEDKHQTVDDKPFGGGEGMVMKPEPLARCLESLFGENERSDRTISIHLSPRGETLNQDLVKDLSSRFDQFVFVSSRYSGVDQRVLNSHIDLEISLGDYVLAGGELPSLILCEALARQIPGFIGDVESVEKDSFSLPGLEAPLYTQPRLWRGVEVPEVLFSGHHLKIEEWRVCSEYLVTRERRPELLSRFSSEIREKAERFYEGLSSEEKKVLGLKV